ncbi:RNA ligase [Auricularia subglabra TFB-10046 SS5]|uniref:RNA ligase n=1 Tax=Auricularia subglabra (strain TFB-10046 / SS5) TaxID=717982 RepID=J0WVK7_AURST|nr:RNA ligase [Auricularia subglabra TFB-10046 SS5]
MVSGNLAEHTSLVSSMRAVAKRSGRLIRSNRYNAPADPTIGIRSWNMDEDAYRKVPCPFPTMARGLFTQWLPAHDGQPEGDQGGNWRIVARGYDKFFEIDETEWTSWNSLETHTAAPYEVMLQTNGCLILIAALTPDKLLVTSKHSLGPRRPGSQVSHAQVGERWLKKHLKSVGKTPADLAARLWKENWTVVCELCDDSFEEHVLPNAPDKTGLHLHGINASQPVFQTQRPAFLQAFAKEWGFIPTSYLTLDSVEEVIEFTDECAKTGSWNGEVIKGFVVRTRVKSDPSENELDGDASDNESPDAPCSSLFFKVKFEKYLLYRDFREITRGLLKGSLHAVQLSASQNALSSLETRVYTLWVQGEIQRNPRLFDGFNQCHGIIATRDRFYAYLDNAMHNHLASQRQQTGRVAALPTSVPKTRSTGKPASGLRSKWIIFPVAIPGCGKTSIAVALSHLFGFAHTQSSDIREQKGTPNAPMFLANVAELLEENDVVIADKNNHLFQHRAGLRKAVAHMRPPVKLLALNWGTLTTNLPRNTVHRICADRVAARGGNHQSLIPGDYGAHEGVLWRFLDETNNVTEEEFDACIEMEVDEDLEQSLERAVDGVVSVLGLPEPSQEQLDDALAKARAYQVASRAKKAPAIEVPRYYALLPEADFAAIVGRRIRAPDTPQALKELWASALALTNKRNQLIVVRPHVTLAHEKNLAGPEQALWNRCVALTPNATFRLRLETFVYNGRVLAAVVGDIRPSEGDQSASTFVQQLSQTMRNRLHVTVARRNASVMPVEAKELVEKWRMNPDGVGTIALGEPVDVVARLRGFAH